MSEIVGEIAKIIEKYKVNRFSVEDYDRIAYEISIRFKDNLKEAYNIYAHIYALREIMKLIENELVEIWGDLNG